MKAALLGALLLMAGPAWATPDEDVSLDLALAYGRHLGQRLNVLEAALEVKGNVLPVVSVGARLAGDLGVSLRSTSAKVFLALPVALKVEAFPTTTPNRPFVGLAVGVAPLIAGGAFVAADTREASGTAWGIKGVKAMITPELGADLTAVRLSLQYRTFLGAQQAIASSVSANREGTTSTDVEAISPGLSGILFQIGLHLGGPKAY